MITQAAPETRPAPLPLRDRVVVLGALGALSGLAWIWLITMPMPGEEGVGSGAGMLMPHAHAWSASDAAAMLAMWTIMMVGMMVPSAAPMVLLYARVAQRDPAVWRGHLRTALFVAGYLVAWGGFSVVAVTVQWGLERAALLTPMMKTASPFLGGALLAAAGIYQLTPAKRICLERCRAPFLFVTERWRPGNVGAFVMGLDHGAYCLCCCWMLMALLFVIGVMNLLWVAMIAAFVLAEKVVPQGVPLARLAGVALVTLGLYVAVAGT